MLEDVKLIELKNICKSFGDTQVLKDINLYIRRKEFVTLLGPSGCGKTTMLRIIGGFETADSGELIFDGKDLSGVPPYKRRVNTVFQKYALFTHMNVFNNIAFGLKLKTPQELLPGVENPSRGQVKDEIARRVERMLKLVKMEKYASRSVDALSGGQQQRSAIARALVNEPEVLLLDEPLGALDLKLRKEMQLELKSMQQRLGITFLYVTHDQEEALTLSDRIAVFNNGNIEQIGTPNEVYNHSETDFVANFIGDINLLDDRIASALKLPEGKKHYIRLERISVLAGGEEEKKGKKKELKTADNSLTAVVPGIVEMQEYYGLYIKYYVRTEGQTLKVIEKNDGINIYEPGERVQLLIRAEDVMSY